MAPPKQKRALKMKSQRRTVNPEIVIEKRYHMFETLEDKKYNMGLIDDPGLAQQRAAFLKKLSVAKKMRGLGAPGGDMIGGPYEYHDNNIFRTDFPLFGIFSVTTDDGKLALTVAEFLAENDVLNMPREEVTTKLLRAYYDAYERQPLVNGGWGGTFQEYARAANGVKNPKAGFASYADGGAMRVGAVIAAARTLEEAILLAEIFTAPTHGASRGINGAAAIAVAGWMAKNKYDKTEILKTIKERFPDPGFQWDKTIEEWREQNRKSQQNRSEICPADAVDAVPIVIRAFIEAPEDSYESVVRLAISAGGDSDTIAAMAGAIAEAAYGIPDHIKEQIMDGLDNLELKQALVYDAYIARREMELDWDEKYKDRMVGGQKPRDVYEELLREISEEALINDFGDQLPKELRRIFAAVNAPEQNLEDAQDLTALSGEAAKALKTLYNTATGNMIENYDADAIEKVENLNRLLAVVEGLSKAPLTAQREIYDEAFRAFNERATKLSMEMYAMRMDAREKPPMGVHPKYHVVIEPKDREYELARRAEQTLKKMQNAVAAECFRNGGSAALAALSGDDLAALFLHEHIQQYKAIAALDPNVPDNAARRDDIIDAKYYMMAFQAGNLDAWLQEMKASAKVTAAMQNLTVEGLKDLHKLSGDDAPKMDSITAVAAKWRQEAEAIAEYQQELANLGNGRHSSRQVRENAEKLAKLAADVSPAHTAAIEALYKAVDTASDALKNDGFEKAFAAELNKPEYEGRALQNCFEGYRRDLAAQIMPHNRTELSSADAEQYTAMCSVFGKMMDTVALGASSAPGGEGILQQMAWMYAAINANARYAPNIVRVAAAGEAKAAIEQKFRQFPKVGKLVDEIEENILSNHDEMQAAFLPRVESRRAVIPEANPNPVFTADQRTAYDKLFQTNAGSSSREYQKLEETYRLAAAYDPRFEEIIPGIGDMVRKKLHEAAAAYYNAKLPQEQNARRRERMKLAKDLFEQTVPVEQPTEAQPAPAEARPEPNAAELETPGWIRVVDKYSDQLGKLKTQLEDASSWFKSSDSEEYHNMLRTIGELQEQIAIANETGVTGILNNPDFVEKEKAMRDAAADYFSAKLVQERNSTRQTRFDTAQELMKLDLRTMVNEQAAEGVQPMEEQAAFDTAKLQQVMASLEDTKFQEQGSVQAFLANANVKAVFEDPGFETKLGMENSPEVNTAALSGAKKVYDILQKEQAGWEVIKNPGNRSKSEVAEAKRDMLMGQGMRNLMTQKGSAAFCSTLAGQRGSLEKVKSSLLQRETVANTEKDIQKTEAKFKAANALDPEAKGPAAK